jgi:hypothetical protein
MFLTNMSACITFVCVCVCVCVWGGGGVNTYIPGNLYLYSAS